MPEEHTDRCPSRGLSWKTADTTPTMFCRKCSKRFPNSYAAVEVKG